MQKASNYRPESVEDLGVNETYGRFALLYDNQIITCCRSLYDRYSIFSEQVQVCVAFLYKRRAHCQGNNNIRLTIPIYILDYFLAYVATDFDEFLRPTRCVIRKILQLAGIRLRVCGFTFRIAGLSQLDMLASGI